jgi:hypothetical protein
MLFLPSGGSGFHLALGVVVHAQGRSASSIDSDPMADFAAGDPHPIASLVLPRWRPCAYMRRCWRFSAACRVDISNVSSYASGEVLLSALAALGGLFCSRPGAMHTLGQYFFPPARVLINVA